MEKKEMDQGSTVSFHNINYTVQVKDVNAKCCCGGMTDKRILKDISGVFKIGMNGILGPTGSGKSSLLDVLAGRKDPSGLRGHVLVDSKKQPANFKCMAGYVVQDDVVMGTLTVRENFMFSASLRLPTSVSEKEKKKRVQDTIDELGLTHVADSKVGNEFIRGVSGGERKRTNIGMELIIQPHVLFLDEPTTGLDASTANSVMNLLYRLSRRGRTIIFSIHQPRFAIYRLFDSMMLLSQGKTVFHGPADQAIDYFSGIGYVIEEHNNPPDFFLDIVNGDAQGKETTPVESVRQAQTPSGPVYLYSGSEGSVKEKFDGSVPNGINDLENGKAITAGSGQAELADRLNEQYIKSTWHASIQQELKIIYDDFKSTSQDKNVEVRQIDYPTSFGHQLKIVSKRCIMNILRNPQTSILQLFVMIIFAVICGVIYLQTDKTSTGLQNRVGAFFFIIMNQVFGNLSAVELFIKERAIFIHENVSGFYRVSAYFLAKVFCDLIPLRAIPVLVFSSIVYFMIGFSPTAGQFFFFFFTLVLVGLAAAALGFTVSASVRVFAIANLLIALSYVFMMVFSGLLVNLNNMAEWLRWIQYLSIFRYALNSLSINELKDEMYCDKDANGTVLPLTCTTGNGYLESQGIKYTTDWDKWQNIFALGVIAIGFLVLAYIQLVRIKKLK